MYHVAHTLKFKYRHDRFTVSVLHRGPNGRVIVPVFTEYNNTPIPAENARSAMLEGLYRCNWLGCARADIEFACDVSENPDIVKNVKSLYAAAKGYSTGVGVVEFATKKMFTVPHCVPDLIMVMPCELDRTLVSSLRAYGRGAVGGATGGHSHVRIRTATPEITAFAREIGVIVEDL